MKSIVGKMWNVVSNPVTVQECHQRDDLAQQKVLFCLRELAREQGDVMFVLSQLDFFDYLGNPCYAHAVKRLGFPKPTTPSNKMQQGDFDVLLIHRHYGIIVGEIKSVHSNHEQLQKSQAEAERDIAKRVNEALEQLNTSELVLRRLTSDLAPQVAIRKTLILPYVARTDIMRALPHTCEQALVHCLGAKDVFEAFDFCLLSDNLSNNQNQWQVEQIQTWWNKRVASAKDPVMTDDLYLNLIARFCGPATVINVHCVIKPRVEARTEGQGVSVVGERMAQLVLTPEQLNLLTIAPRRVFLHGPPGTGKSLALALMAIKWVNDGNNVCVVSLHYSSLAVSHLIKQQVEKTANQTGQNPGSVKLLQYSFFTNGFAEVFKAVGDFRKEAAMGRDLLVILDELSARSVKEILGLFWYLRQLCKHPRVALWAACSFHKYSTPGVELVEMTIPLRSPPTVQNEVERIYSWYDVTYLKGYTKSCLVAPCDGLGVSKLMHEGPGHKKLKPKDCVECGRNIANVLTQLGVGQRGQGSRSRSTKRYSKTISAPPLEYRDVFVLTSSVCLYDDGDVDESGHVTRASGVVRGLREKGVPVFVFGSKGEENVAAAKDDMVTVCHYLRVSGLERKVVVVLQNKDVTTPHTDREIDTYDRFHAMSRCTSQLVIVRMANSYAP